MIDKTKYKSFGNKIVYKPEIPSSADREIRNAIAISAFEALPVDLVLGNKTFEVDYKIEKKDHYKVVNALVALTKIQDIAKDAKNGKMPLSPTMLLNIAERALAEIQK